MKHERNETIQITSFVEKVETCTIPLTEGDLCVLYTDGITEAMNEKDELYTEKRFVELLKNSSHQSAEELNQAIMKDIIQHRGEREQNDDISLIVFGIN